LEAITMKMSAILGGVLLTVLGVGVLGALVWVLGLVVLSVAGFVVAAVDDIRRHLPAPSTPARPRLGQPLPH
jgi:Na+-transporting methylmalonyl-CoA/oxaloacetate decarboxylase gamma subunit